MIKWKLTFDKRLCNSLILFFSSTNNYKGRNNIPLAKLTIVGVYVYSINSQSKAAVYNFESILINVTFSHMIQRHRINSEITTIRPFNHEKEKKYFRRTYFGS